MMKGVEGRCRRVDGWIPESRESSSRLGNSENCRATKNSAHLRERPIQLDLASPPFLRRACDPKSVEPLENLGPRGMDRSFLSSQMNDLATRRRRKKGVRKEKREER